MNVIIIANPRLCGHYGKKVSALDEKFRTTGSSVRIIPWGAHMYGYRADLIILAEPPDYSGHTWDWYQTLETRLSIDGFILDLTYG